MIEKNKNFRHPLQWVPSSYFAMGLPFVMLNMVAVLMFKSLGLDDGQIALWTSLIMFPWTLKFIWSPFMEIVKSKKSIVVITQLITGLAFGLIALCLGLSHFFAISIALLTVIAFSAATHDVALDGLYMQELDNKRQAEYIGWQGAFYNIAKLIATGALVWFAGYLMTYFKNKNLNINIFNNLIKLNPAVLSWSVIMLIAGLIMIVLSFYHHFYLAHNQADIENKTKHETADPWVELKTVLKDFISKKHILYYIFFIIVYRLGEGFVMKIVPLFLKSPQGLGLTEQQIGIYYGSFGAAAFVIGSLLAGYFISSVGLRKSLIFLVCVFNLPFFVYPALAYFHPHLIYPIAAGIILEYFGYGFGFVGLTLFMMQQVAPGKYRMAHYAIASAIMNLSVVVTGSVSGYISDALGYKNFFILVLVISFPIIVIMTYKLKFNYDDKGNELVK